MGRRAAASGSEDASGLERFSVGQLGRTTSINVPSQIPLAWG